MLSRSMLPELSVDPSMSRTIILVRNYLDEPDETTRMWEFMKGEYTLFDFAKLSPLDDYRLKFEEMDASTKLLAMQNSWGCKSNTIYAHYLDRGMPNGIAFSTDGRFKSDLGYSLAIKFPSLEFLIFSYPRNLSSGPNPFFAEFKGDANRSIRLLSGDFNQYFYWKAMWGEEFRYPMAFDVNRSGVCFLNKPEELNYEYQTKHGIFYAAYVKSIFDCLPLKSLLTNSQLSEDENGNAPLEFFYQKKPLPKE